MRAGFLIALGLTLGLTQAARAEEDSKKAERLFHEAQEAFQAGRYQTALERYEAAYELAPLPDILFNIAQSHRNLGQYDEAATKFRRFLRKRPKASNAAAVRRTIDQLEVLIEATDHFRQRRYERALESYRRAQKLEALPTIHRDVARTLEQLGRYQEAIDAYQKYLEERPKAEDRADVEDAISRLDREIAGPSPIDGGEREGRPVYRRWWFWGGVAAAAVVLGGFTAYALSGHVPGSDLGNVEFGQ